uniref:helix-turn-helix transcriptional regulator n=1 Tax=Candidatus Planktophila sp. TaxID=2175601 RepID=UPI00404A9586
MKIGDAQGEDLPTRDAIARLILEHGPATASTLSQSLALTPAGIRRHLELLVADGILEAREPRTSSARGRGRPSKVFLMTDAGRAQFEHTYDDLAVSALRFMASHSGAHLVASFAQSRADDIEVKANEYINQNRTTRKNDKAALLAEFLTDQGYAASVEDRGLGEEICQHHCPIAHVASAYPQLCEAETQAFSRLLGTHVQRLATIAHGDGVCTTYIPQLTTTAGKAQ